MGFVLRLFSFYRLLLRLDCSRRSPLFAPVIDEAPTWPAEARRACVFLRWLLPLADSRIANKRMGLDQESGPSLLNMHRFVNSCGQCHTPSLFAGWMRQGVSRGILKNEKQATYGGTRCGEWKHHGGSTRRFSRRTSIQLWRLPSDHDAKSESDDSEPGVYTEGACDGVAGLRDQ